MKISKGLTPFKSAEFHFQFSIYKIFNLQFLSGRRDSNPRPTAWKAVTLPTELLPHSIPDCESRNVDCSAVCTRHSAFKLWAGEDSNLRRREPSDLQSDAFDRFATYPTSGHVRSPPTRNAFVRFQALFRPSRVPAYILRAGDQT